MRSWSSARRRLERSTGGRTFATLFWVTRLPTHQSCSNARNLSLREGGGSFQTTAQLSYGSRLTHARYRHWNAILGSDEGDRGARGNLLQTSLVLVRRYRQEPEDQVLHSGTHGERRIHWLHLRLAERCKREVRARGNCPLQLVRAASQAISNAQRINTDGVNTR